MNCLKCPNYWKTDIDETQCDKCDCSAEPSEAKEEEDPFHENDPYVVTNPMAFY